MSGTNSRRGVVVAGFVLLGTLTAVVLSGAAVDRLPSACADREVRAAESSEPVQAAVGVEPGKVAQEFTLPDLDEQPLSLSELRGCVVVIEFWASWCPPCWESARHLDELRQRHEGRGLVVVGVSLDYSRAAIDRFLQEVGDPGMVVLWGSLAEARGVAEKYEVRAIPRALVIDRRGVIRFVGHPARITDSLLEPLW